MKDTPAANREYIKMRSKYLKLKNSNRWRNSKQKEKVLDVAYVGTEYVHLPRIVRYVAYPFVLL